MRHRPSFLLKASPTSICSNWIYSVPTGQSGLDPRGVTKEKSQILLLACPTYGTISRICLIQNSNSRQTKSEATHGLNLGDDQTRPDRSSPGSRNRSWTGQGTTNPTNPGRRLPRQGVGSGIRPASI